MKYWKHWSFHIWEKNSFSLVPFLPFCVLFCIVKLKTFKSESDHITE